MTPHEMIDRYVHAVTRRLPMRLREDVGAELRALLGEELGAQPVRDLDAAKALLTRFGAPAEVAARYAPPALVVEARDTHMFWQVNGIIALVLLVIAAVTVIAAEPIAGQETQLTDLLRDLVERGLMMLGITALAFWVVGVFRRRNPQARIWDPGSLEPVRDPDHINRVGYSFAFAYFVIGMLTLIWPVASLGVFWGGHMPAAAEAAFTYDPAFRATRGPIVLALMTASLALLAFVIVEGRWRRASRIAEIALNLVSAGVYIWVLRAGPVFVSEPVDQLVKFIVIIIAVTMLVDAAFKLRRMLAGGGRHRPHSRLA